MNEIAVMQGDQYAVPFELAGADGEPLTADDIVKIEIVIGPLKKCSPSVFFNVQKGFWEFPLTQEETLGLSPSTLRAQVRAVYPDGSVVGADAGFVTIIASMSDEVL